jgi:hypothetical protein
MALKDKIRVRRDTTANFTSANPVLSLGEISFDTTTKQFKVGDGASTWTSLPYSDAAATASSISTALASYTPTSSLSAIATSGSASDLSGTLSKSQQHAQTVYKDESSVLSGTLTLISPVNAGSSNTIAATYESIKHPDDSTSHLILTRTGWQRWEVAPAGSSLALFVQGQVSNPDFTFVTGGHLTCKGNGNFSGKVSCQSPVDAGSRQAFDNGFIESTKASSDTSSHLRMSRTGWEAWELKQPAVDLVLHILGGDAAPDFTFGRGGNFVCKGYVSAAINHTAITKSALLALSPSATAGEYRITDSTPAQRRAYPDGTNWRYSDDSTIVT